MTDGFLPAPACAPAVDAGAPHRAPSAFQRKDAILSSACSHFGRFGFRGASLRDIARDAGVSLTLLNHHFDNKAGLLSAVIAAHRPTLRRRTLALKQLRSPGPGVLQPAELVRAWITILFESRAERDGQQFLHLLARLGADGSEEAAAIRGQLDEGADAFVSCLRRCYPGASQRAAMSAYLCVNASLLSIVTNADLLQENAEASNVDRAWLERFLVSGIDAALSHPEPTAAAPDGVADKAWTSPKTLAHS